MDKPKPSLPCNFRARGKGQELIERALKLNVDVTGVLNAMLEKHGAEYFEPAINARKREMRELLKAA